MIKHYFDESGKHIISTINFDYSGKFSQVILSDNGYDGLDIKLVNNEILATLRSLSMANGRERLRLSGFLGNIDDLISSLPQAQKERASIWWEYGASIDRENKETKMIAAALWPDQEKREAILDLLYSVDWDDNESPVAISKI